MQQTALTSHWTKWIALVALASLGALALASCDGDKGGSDAAVWQAGPPDDGYVGPPRGEWKGDFIDFTVLTEGVAAIQVHGVSCKSVANHCTDELDDQSFSDGLTIEVRTNESTKVTEWHLVGTLGKVTKIDGIFMPLDVEPYQFTSVSGTLTFESDACACDKTTFFWSTSFVPPKDPNTPDAGGGGPGGEVPDDATPGQIKALERVNWYRDQIGVPTVDMLASLNAMATDHCACYAKNISEYKKTGMSPHDEDPSWEEPCYGDLGKRAAAHGVSLGGGVSEVMAFMNSPAKAVDGWIATLYHRLPLTDPGTKAIGYGGAAACDTINSSGGGSSSDWEVVYPYDGQEGVDLSWDGAESPQPPPPKSGYPSGPIITIQFGSGVTFTMQSSELLDEAGDAVPHTLLTPKNDPNLAGSPAASLYADSPLKPETAYTVKLTGTRVNKPWSKTWSFRTGKSGAGAFWP